MQTGYFCFRLSLALKKIICSLRGSAMIDDFSQLKLEAVASHHPDTYMGLEGFIYFDNSKWNFCLIEWPFTSF